jgi:hypothetical protein
MPQVLLPLAACTEIATVHKHGGVTAAGLFASKLLEIELFLWAKKDSSCMKILHKMFQPKNS